VYNPEEQKILTVRFEGFQRGLYDMYKKMGFRVEPMQGKDIQWSKHLCTLVYKLVLSGGQMVLRKTLVPFMVIEDAGTWLDYIEAVIVGDVRKIVHQVVEMAKKPQPQFRIV
jgi:hypothetical protein